MSSFVPDFESIRSVVVEDFDGSALRAFKDCHRGERCFILGNGPSLRATDLAPLADEITFGVNGIFYMTWQCGFAPTYFVVEDNHVFADNLERIEAVDAVARFFPSKYRPVIRPTANTHFLPTDWSFYWGSSEWYETPRFSHDVSEVIYAGQTVTFLNLQLAAYMGCTEVYLVGVDYEYQIPADAEVDGLTITSVDDDPNHFHPDYFGKGKRWHLPKLDNVAKAMVCAKSGAEEVGTTVFNATVGGKLEIFPRADFQELVGRPATPEPNEPGHYLLSRALERAARNDLKTVTLDTNGAGTDLDAILAASQLGRVEDDDADIVVTDRPPGRGDDVAVRRVLVLLDESAVGEAPSTTPAHLTQVLVDCLADGRSAFMTRSLLEFSPDGESLVIPALGRSSQIAVDPTREYGVDDLGGTLDASHATRWAYGRSLSLDQLAELAATILRHQHSVGVIDGYVYVQSRWKPTEPPSGVLTRRQPMEGRHLDGLRP
jgi:hypothetical protein